MVDQESSCIGGLGVAYMFRLNREEIHFANKLTASRISRLLPE